MDQREEPEPKIEPKTWINPISGLLYEWDEAEQVWRSTKKYPLGTNPMGFLGDGAW